MIAIRTVLALLLAAATLAGCAGKPDAATAAVSPAAVTATPAPNATANASMETPTPVPVPVAYQGTSAQGACTYGTPADQCQFSSSGTETFHKIDYKGRATHLAVQVTYPAQQPGFAMYVGLCASKPGAAVTSNDCADYQTAPSPMTLEFDLAKAPPGTAFGLSIGSVAAAPTPSGALLFAQSDFKVQGTMTTVAG